jgi:predicted MFS family arabinose efflux permease
LKDKKPNTVLGGALCAIIIVLTLFNFWLNYLTFRTNVENGEASLIYTVCKQYVNKIEYAIRYGKPIDRFFGIEEILNETKSKDENIKNVAVLLPDSTVLYSLDIEVNGKFETNKDISFTKKADKYVFSAGKHTCDILIPIYSEDEWIGTFAVSINEELIDKQITAFVYANCRYLGFLILVGCLIVIGVIRIIYNKKEDLLFGKSRKVKKDNKQLMISAIVIIAVIQIIGSVPMIEQYEKMALENSTKTSILIQDTLYNQIKEVIDKGLNYDDLYDLQEWIDDYVEELPQIDKVLIKPISESTDKQYVYTRQLPADSKGNVLPLNVLVLKSYIKSKVREVELDGVTILITTIIMLLEVILLIGSTLELKKRYYSAEIQKVVYRNFSRLRAFAFLFTMVCQLPSSFVPVVINRIYEPSGGASVELMASLAVSMYVLGTMITTLSTGFLLKRHSWVHVFKVGLLVMAGGLFLSATVSNIYFFIVARAIDGCGYGLAWMALRGSLENETEKSTRTKLLTGVNSGLFSGVNCGVIIGAMLFDRLGYALVFIVAGAGTVGLFLLANLFLKNIPVSLMQAKDIQKYHSKGLFNLQVIAFLILIAIPSSMFIMFLKYYFPLYAKTVEFSQSNTGRVFLIYGLIVVYAAPVLTKVMCNKVGLKRSTYIAFVGIAAAMMVFAIKPSISMAILVVIIMGFMDSFGLTAQNEYFGEIEGVKKMGYAKAMGGYNTIKKLGQTMAPTLFAVLTSLGFTSGVGFMGIISLIMFGIYIVITIIKNKENYISYKGREEWF